MQFINSMFVGNRFIITLVLFISMLCVIERGCVLHKRNKQLKIDISTRVDESIAKFKAQKFYTPGLRAELKMILYRAEKTFGLNHRKVLACWRLESNMWPRVTGYNRNGTSDGGLGQINSPNLSWLPKASIRYIKKMNLDNYTYLMRHVDVFNPITNALMSISYMVILQKKYGKGWRSVISYNAGRPVRLVGRYKAYYRVYSKNYENLI